MVNPMYMKGADSTASEADADDVYYYGMVLYHDSHLWSFPNKRIEIGSS